MKKKIVALFLAVTLLATFFTSCSQDSSSKVSIPTSTSPAASQISDFPDEIAGQKPTDKLIVWVGAGEGAPSTPIHSKAVDLFKEAFPNVEVELHYMGSDAVSALQVMLQNPDDPDFPDIVTHSDSHIKSYAKDGIIWDMTEALQTPAWGENDKTWYETFSPSLMEQLKYNGKDIIIPDSKHTAGWFYNKKLFEELDIAVPTNWDEFLSVCDQLKEAGVAPIAVDGSLDLYNIWMWTAYAERYVDKDVFDAARDGKADYSDPGFLKAAELVYSMYEKQLYQPGFEGYVFPAAQSVLAQGDAAMMFCGSWLPSEMSNLLPDDFEMAVFPIPSLPDEKYSNVAEVWGDGGAILELANNKYNAVNYLKILSSKEVMPVAQQINPSPRVDGTQPAVLNGVQDFVENATVVYPNMNMLGNYGEYTTSVIGPLSTQLVCGQISPEEFIKQLNEKTAAFYA